MTSAIRILSSAGILALSAPAQSETQPQAPAPQPAALQAGFPSLARVITHVRTLADPAMEGRLAGSAGGRRAGMYIAGQFKKFELEPLAAEEADEQASTDQPAAKGSAGDPAAPPTEYHQKFDWIRTVFVRDPETKRLRKQPQAIACHNIVGAIRGSSETDEFLVLGAHYDHLGKRGDRIYNGADDNASGVAGLLAIAEAIATAKTPPRRTIYFVAFDAEEQGLRGAKHFARHPPRSLRHCIAMINLDMIGRGKLLDYEKFALLKPLVGIPSTPAVGVLGTSQSPELAKHARTAFTAAKLPLFGPEDFGPLRSIIEKQAAGRSDHAPFEARKIPFLFFSTSENDDYHQPTDTIDKVDPAALHHLSRTIHHTIQAIDSAAERPTFVEPKQKRSKRSKR